MADKIINVKMGNEFNPIKLHKELLAFRHTKHSLSHEDLNAFGEIIEKHAKMVGPGTEFSHSQKIALRHDLMKLPSLSHSDKMTLKKVISTGM